MQSPEVDKQLESLEEVFFSWKFERPWLWVRLFEMELSFDPLWNCTIGTCSDFFDLLNITGQESMSQTLDWSKAFNKDLRIMIANITCFHMLLRVSYSKYMAVCACCYYDVFWHIMGPYDFDPLLWLGCFSYRLRRWRDCFVCLTCHCNLAQQNRKKKKKKNRKPGRWCLR